jgi:predicted metal-dependent HD superfamily phosphohydrolase
MSVSLASWQRTWQELGVPTADEALYRQLLACWREPQRHYHTLQHLGECLAHFDAAQGFARRPGEVALALWFHDAIYDPRRDDNELRSAQWARTGMMDAQCGAHAADRVHALVMATRHKEVPQDADAQLLVDIDLSILGAPAERFDQSDEQIRAEYAHVPEAPYREGRRRILGGFLARPRLYSTEYFHSRLDERARTNLQRALARLAD